MISKIDPNDLTLKQLFDQYRQNSRAGSVSETGAIQPMAGTADSGDQLTDGFGKQNAFNSGETQQGKEEILGDLNQLLISVVDEIE